MHDVIVVGGGIFGATISKYLKDNGHDVLCIDAQKRGCGTKPAACLMKPSWMSSLSKEEISDSMQALEATWGVREFEFRVELITGRKLLNQKVSWVDPRQIIEWTSSNAINGSVTEVSPGEVVVGHNREPMRYLARHVVVAAGWWSKNILWKPDRPEILAKLKGMAGTSLVTRERLLPESDFFIRSFTSYRQSVAFTFPKLTHHRPHTWIGDGTSVSVEKFSAVHRNKSIDRAAKALDVLPSSLEELFGVRPAIDGAKREFVGQVAQEGGKTLWLATGGAKNGTIGAGLAASVIVGALS